MPQSLSNLALHLTFATKDRARSLAYPDVRAGMAGYIVGILKNMGCPSIATKVVIDHIHVLFLLSRTESVSHVVQVVKQESSAWVKGQKPELKDPYLIKFQWQAGYAVFSVSESNVAKVKAYFENQDEHHKRVTFEEEYREFLTKHGVAFDERYMWD
jgi:putative transposase